MNTNRDLTEELAQEEEQGREESSNDNFATAAGLKNSTAGRSLGGL